MLPRRCSSSCEVTTDSHGFLPPVVSRPASQIQKRGLGWYTPSLYSKRKTMTQKAPRNAQTGSRGSYGNMARFAFPVLHVDTPMVEPRASYMQVSWPVASVGPERQEQACKQARKQARGLVVVSVVVAAFAAAAAPLSLECERHEAQSMAEVV
jgi:hypothetical protein